MLLSHRYKFILIKTRKTAGSSLEGLLEPLCAPEGHVAAHEAEELVTPAGIVGTRADGKGKRNGYWAHMAAERIRKQVGPRVFDSYLKIVPVRDPYDKVLSWFWHLLPEADRAPAAADFETARTLFRRWMAMRPTLNTDVKFYRTRAGRFPCMTVRYEHLAEDIDALATRIGADVSAAQLPDWKTSSRSHRNRALAEYYDRASAAAVRKHFRFDFRHFGYDPDSLGL